MGLKICKKLSLPNFHYNLGNKQSNLEQTTFHKDLKKKKLGWSNLKLKKYKNNTIFRNTTHINLKPIAYSIITVN